MSRIRALVPSRAMAVALLALFVALSGTAIAATGGNFVLGQGNAATSQSGLTANFAGKALAISNTNTTTGATALGLTVASGHAPFTVSSGTKVKNLNADKLDGIDSTGFLAAGGKASDSDLLDGQDSTAYQHYTHAVTVATSDCVTSVQLWTGCAPITINVPSGKTYSITVESTVNGYSGQTQTIGFCAAHDGPDCLDFNGNPELLTLWGGAYTMGTSMQTWYVGGPSTFTAQTAIKLASALNASANAKTTTRVDVYDATEELSH